MLVFDTSAFINSWRVHYRPGTFPTVWDRLDEAMGDGRIVCPRMVYTELESKDDDMFKWAHERVAMFNDPSEAVQRAVGSIQASFPNPSVRDRADPFVIAEAQARGFAVVSYEGTNTRTGERTKQWPNRMPGICQGLGIDCHVMPDALEKLGIVI